MDDEIKASIDKYFEELNAKLDMENIKKILKPFDKNTKALEYFEDKLEDTGYLLDDAEEYVGSAILELDE